MKHFDNIINNMIQMHKDTNTQYSSTQMFDSANDLSFAISRLMDAQRFLSDEYIDHKDITTDMRTLWFKLKDELPSETAKTLAICIMKNTPFSNSQKQTDEIEKSFYTSINQYTQNEALALAFTQIFFGEKESKMPRMRDH